ncbi:hypothetical protein OkiPb00241_49830 [Escherichia coli]
MQNNMLKQPGWLSRQPETFLSVRRLQRSVQRKPGAWLRMRGDLRATRGPKVIPAPGVKKVSRVREVLRVRKESAVREVLRVVSARQVRGVRKASRGSVDHRDYRG